MKGSQPEWKQRLHYWDFTLDLPIFMVKSLWVTCDCRTETVGIWYLLKIGHLGYINQMLSCCCSALLAIGYWPFWDQSQAANGRNSPNYRWRMLLLIKEIWNKKQWEAHKRINTASKGHLLCFSASFFCLLLLYVLQALLF